MAGYSPPTGVITLTLKKGYVPPPLPVTLPLGPPATGNATFSVRAKTYGAIAAVRIRATSRVQVEAKTGGAKASSHVAFDPNLLSPIHATVANAWQAAPPEQSAVLDCWQDARSLQPVAIDQWREALASRAPCTMPWRASMPQRMDTADCWHPADGLSGDALACWQDSALLVSISIPEWDDAVRAAIFAESAWIRTLPQRLLMQRETWRDATRQSLSIVDQCGDGVSLLRVQIEYWREATYPSNSYPVGPELPTPPHGYQPPSGTVILRLCRRGVAAALPATLILGPPRCGGFAWIVVPRQRTYRVLNSCSLVRLPDRAPLPVTSMTIETDTDSWCWALSATLATAAGWELVRPMPPGFLPVEVEATINGHVWRFLLDQPSATRGFGQHRQAIKGRSRSAWLHDPFTARTLGVESNPRTVQQLAEQALTNLGWTLIWQLPTDWLIPGGVYSWSATPIEQLLNLVKPVDGCLYTDPQAAILTAYPRYPTPAWLWDGQPADVGIPEDALATLDRAPDHRPIINGCYVSGVQYGHVAWVKVAGTDGALVPPEPVVDPLLTSPDALRLRGLSILSASGPGHTLSATMQLTPSGGSGPGLLRPGQIVAMASVRGRVRSVRVTAEWSQGLKVRQSVSIERREVEP